MNAPSVSDDAGCGSNMTELVFKNEVFAVIGAAFEVHNILGCGFLEAVYQEALEIEFSARGIPFRTQPEIPIKYKEQKLTKKYGADFVVYDAFIVELKAMDRLSGTEMAQVLNYLKATGMKCGLLINFGGKKLEWKRIVL
jgi:GxxExxY protein